MVNCSALLELQKRSTSYTFRSIIGCVVVEGGKCWDENAWEHFMVCLRRIHQRFGLAAIRSDLVHYDHRYPLRQAVLQVRVLILLAFQERDHQCRRRDFHDRQYHLDYLLRTADGDRQRGPWPSLVHHDRGDPLRQTVFQDREIGFDAVRSKNRRTITNSYKIIRRDKDNTRIIIREQAKWVQRCFAQGESRFLAIRQTSSQSDLPSSVPYQGAFIMKRKKELSRCWWPSLYVYEGYITEHRILPVFALLLR